LKWRGRWYLNKWSSARAMASSRAKVRSQTTRSKATLPLEGIVRRLNPILRGWGKCFRYGNSSQKFAAIDA